MKIKSDFVTNSSSSSFIILKECLSPLQIQQIHDHFKDVAEFHSPYDKWEISETEDEIRGSTIMDNFDMDEYLEKIGVNPRDIRWTW